MPAKSVTRASKGIVLLALLTLGGSDIAFAPKSFRVFGGELAFAAPAPSPVRSPPQIQWITDADFRALAVELAPKVNVFRAVWRQDPSAELFGGVVRDYLMWLRKELKGAHTLDEARAKISNLRLVPTLDIRDIALYQVDIDVVSTSRLRLDPKDFGISKFERVDPSRLDVTSPLGADEFKQGYIPVEKIRLGQAGFAPPGAFGDGVGEFYRGRFTYHASDREAFNRTRFAQLKLNHPILLALRYLRVLALNNEDPTKHETAYDAMDEASASALKSVVRESSKPGALAEYLAQPKFVEWLTQTLDRSFRASGDTTATYQLLKNFGIIDLLAQYRGLYPTNQFLFSKNWDQKEIDRSLREQAFKPEELFADPLTEFPNGYLFHGTHREVSFRDIVLRGVIASAHGSAGSGLYGVSQGDINFAASWGGGNHLVVKFPVAANARILDISKGEGARLWSAFHELGYDGFCEKFGVDILKYEYVTDSGYAYVAKNSLVLGRGEGVYRTIETYATLAQRAANARAREDVLAIVKSLKLGNFTTSEIHSVLKQIPSKKLYVYAWRLKLRDRLIGNVETVEIKHWKPSPIDITPPNRDYTLPFFLGAAASYWTLTHGFGVESGEAVMLSIAGGMTNVTSQMAAASFLNTRWGQRIRPLFLMNPLLRVTAGNVAATTAIHCLSKFLTSI